MCNDVQILPERERLSRDDMSRRHVASSYANASDPLLGGTLLGQRVRFAEQDTTAFASSLDEDMRRRDILAEITGIRPAKSFSCCFD